MGDRSVPPAPRGAKTAGKRLWAAVQGEYQLEAHEEALLRQMVRAVDELDALAAAVARDGLMVEVRGGGERVHPAAVESRQLGVTLARLAAALRLPAGDEEGDAKGGMRRPQRRAGVRGVYSLRGVG